MVIANPLASDQAANEDVAPRRPATVQALDARLSVWGQASREAVERRAEALARGAVLYVERVGRNAEILRAVPLDHRMALLSTETEVLVLVAASLLPAAVKNCCRLLWVDPDKLFQRLMDDLAPAIDGARAEIRRRQALYRRRARLWQNDTARLNRLRDEVESLRVPRCGSRASERIARGLLERHREDARMEIAPPSEPVNHAKLRVRAGSIARWIDQLNTQISDEPVTT
jgi:hypothetical protein